MTRRRARLTVFLLAQAVHLQFFFFSAVFLSLGSGHRICRQQRDCSRHGSEGEGDNVMRVSGQVFSSRVVGTTKNEKLGDSRVPLVGACEKITPRRPRLMNFEPPRDALFPFYRYYRRLRRNSQLRIYQTKPERFVSS